MTKTTTPNICFDLSDTVKHNFTIYQEALEAYPDAFRMLKMRFDQYLKAVPVYKREQDVDDAPDIAFTVARWGTGSEA